MKIQQTMTSIIIIIITISPKNDPKSMADYHAHKHFYMICTGYAKDEQAFYQALKEVIIRLKKLEDEQNVEMKYWWMELLSKDSDGYLEYKKNK